MRSQDTNNVDHLAAVVAAWCVHALTASGALLGVAALVQAQHQHWQAFFGLLVVAAGIDSVDGALARRFRVKEVLPRIDGALLDNMVDFFTYVIVPATYVCSSGDLPRWGGVAAAGLMVFSSAYQFSQTDAKTDDHYFKGWPSYWNVVVLYIYLLDLGPRTSFVIIAICAVLVFVPVKYLYPSRTERFRAVTLALTSLWAVGLLVSLAAHDGLGRILAWASLVYVVYYIAMSVWITATGGSHSQKVSEKSTRSDASD